MKGRTKKTLARVCSFVLTVALVFGNIPGVGSLFSYLAEKTVDTYIPVVEAGNNLTNWGEAGDEEQTTDENGDAVEYYVVRQTATGDYSVHSAYIGSTTHGNCWMLELGADPTDAGSAALAFCMDCGLHAGGSYTYLGNNAGYTDIQLKAIAQTLLQWYGNSNGVASYNANGKLNYTLAQLQLWLISESAGLTQAVYEGRDAYTSVNIYDPDLVADLSNGYPRNVSFSAEEWMSYLFLISLIDTGSTNGPYSLASLVGTYYYIQQQIALSGGAAMSYAQDLRVIQDELNRYLGMNTGDIGATMFQVRGAIADYVEAIATAGQYSDAYYADYPLFFWGTGNASNQKLVTIRIPMLPNEDYGCIKIAVDKVDEGGNPITDPVIFSVYDEDMNLISETYSEELGAMVPATITQTNDNHYEGVLYGDVSDIFYIVETTAPAGMIADTTPIAVEIVYNAGRDLNADGDIQTDEAETVYISNNGGLTFVNGANPGVQSGVNVRIVKRDGGNGNILSDECEFTVYSDAACTQEVTSTVKNLAGENETVPVTWDFDSATGTYTCTLYGSTGTVFYIKETAAPDGYGMDGHAYPVTITEAVYSPDVYYDLNSIGRNDGFYNMPYSVNLVIHKVDEESLSAIQSEADFVVVDRDGNIQDVTFTRVNGGNRWAEFYTSSEIYYNEENQGLFYLVERTAPNNYYGDWEGGAGSAGSMDGKVLYEFEVSEDNAGETLEITNGSGESETLFVNDIVYGSISLTKYDIESGTQLADGENGETTLHGVVYGLFARNDIIYPDGYRGVAYSAGDLVAVSATDENGNLDFDGLYMGAYFVRELYVVNGDDNKHAGFRLIDGNGDVVSGHILYHTYDRGFDDMVATTTPEWDAFIDSGIYTRTDAGFTRVNADSEHYEHLEWIGYLADDVEHDVTLTYANESTEVVTESTESYDQALKGRISWYKRTSSEISEESRPLAGAGFTIYRIDQLSLYDESWLNADGTYNVAAIRSAYLAATPGSFYNPDTGQLETTYIYDFSGETDAIATTYASDTDTDSVLNFDDGSGNSLTQWYYEQMQADLAAGRVTYLGNNEYRVNELFSDEYGRVTSPYLPFGHYIIVETTVPENREQALPFLLNLYTNVGSQLVSNGIGVDVEYGYTLGNSDPDSMTVKPGSIYEAWYTYSGSINDKEITMRVTLHKYDSDTNMEILKPAEYAIYQITELTQNGNPITTEEGWQAYQDARPNVTFTTNAEGVTTWSELDYTGYAINYELRILEGVYYKAARLTNEVDVTLTDTFMTTTITDENGIIEKCVIETQQLQVGEYLVEEVEAPSGFWNNPDYYITFRVSTSQEYEIEAELNAEHSRDYLLDRRYYDDETRGRLTIYKQGEVLVGVTEEAVTDSTILDSIGLGSANTYTFLYEERYAAGAEYYIYAAEDIYTQDGQYARDDNGDIIYETDEYGYTEPTYTTWFREGDLVAVIRTGYAGQNTTEYVIYDGTAPSCEITYDGTDYSAVYYGESTGTYSELLDGHPIVSVIVDEEGKVTVDLPLGAYTVTEGSAPYGMTTSLEDYDVAFEWDNQGEQFVYTCEIDNDDLVDVTYEENRSNEAEGYREPGLLWTNQRFHAEANVVKINSVNGGPLQGVVMGLFTYDNIYDYQGNVLVNASPLSPTLIGYGISDENGEIVFNTDIPIGCYIEDANGSYMVASTQSVAVGDVLNGFVEETGYTLSGNYAYGGTNACAYYGGYPFEESTAPYMNELIDLLNAMDFEESDPVLVRGIDIYEMVLQEEEPATWEEEIDLGVAGLKFVLVTPATGMYMLVQDVVTANTGNYVIKELYTDYGIFIDDDDYAISYHVYHDAMRSVTTTMNGSEEVTFVVSDDDEPEDLTGENSLVNDATQTVISKRDITNAAELAGAHFVLIDNTNATIADQWVSNGSAHSIFGLRLNNTLPAGPGSPGTYTLRETAAPAGYIANLNDITFALVRVPAPTNNTVSDNSIQADVLLSGEMLSGNFEAEYDNNQSESNIVHNVDDTYTVYASLSALQSYGATPHPYIGIAIDTGCDDITQVSIDGGVTYLTEEDALEAANLSMDDGCFIYWMEADTFPASGVSVPLHIEGMDDTTVQIYFVDTDNVSMEAYVAGEALGGDNMEAYALNQSMTTVVRNADGSYTVRADLDRLVSYTSSEPTQGTHKWIGVGINTVISSDITTLDLDGLGYLTESDVLEAEQYSLPDGYFIYWMSADSMTAAGRTFTVTADDGDSASIMVYFEDVDGSPVVPSEDPDDYLDGQWETYFWSRSYGYVEESIILASGTYDNDAILWTINGEGVVLIERADTTATYTFADRAYDTDGNLTSAVMPWEEDVIYQTDESGAQILDEEGNPIPITVAVSKVMLESTTDILFPEGYLENYTLTNEFNETEVREVITSEGWTRVDNSIVMYNHRGTPTPNTPTPNPPSYTPPTPDTPGTPNLGPVYVSKQTVTGSAELPGAKLAIYDSNGNLVDTWISTTEPHFVWLERGQTYTLEELWAQTGYSTGATITFTVRNDGSVTHVTMVDEYTQVTLSKVDITGEDELPGAVMTLTDMDGNLIEQWVSGTSPHYINGRLEGGQSYILTETAAPNGYRYAQSIVFTVNFDNTVTYVKMVDVPQVTTGDTLPYSSGMEVWLLLGLVLVCAVLRAHYKRRFD